MTEQDAGYVGRAACEKCGWETTAEAGDLATLRSRLDLILGAHVCCRICKQVIVKHAGRWWHVAAASSTLPRSAEPWSADLDDDHEASPAQIDRSED